MPIYTLEFIEQEAMSILSGTEEIPIPDQIRKAQELLKRTAELRVLMAQLDI